MVIRDDKQLCVCFADNDAGAGRLRLLGIRLAEEILPCLCEVVIDGDHGRHNLVHNLRYICYNRLRIVHRKLCAAAGFALFAALRAAVARSGLLRIL